jgi:hypothetical protein
VAIFHYDIKSKEIYEVVDRKVRNYVSIEKSIYCLQNNKIYMNFIYAMNSYDLCLTDLLIHKPRKFTNLHIYFECISNIPKFIFKRITVITYFVVVVRFDYSVTT